MKKTIEQLIADFKKSNKQRKQRIATKAGFSTPEEYLKSLTESPKKTEKVKVAKKKKEEKVVMDYVVAFDSTASMGSYIASVKKHVQELIPQMFSQGIDLKMQIVVFGDYCDMNGPNNFGRAYQISQFTNNQESLINFVKTAQNTAGGDEDEFYELVIKKIVEETPWRKDSTKVVLLIGDCEPHRVGYSLGNYVKNNQIDWKIEASKAADLNIQFDTLTIRQDYRSNWYKELSKITNGVSLPFKNSEKVQEVVKMSSYSRGGTRSKAVFMAGASAAMASGDTELIGAYKAMSVKL